MKAFIAASSAFAAMLAASPGTAQVQQSLCQSFSGQFVNIAGRINNARVEGGVARYVIDQADLPCLTAVFTVEDSSGQLRCHEGQWIIASGIVNATEAKASISTTDYSCQ